MIDTQIEIARKTKFNRYTQKLVDNDYDISVLTEEEYNHILAQKNKANSSKNYRKIRCGVLKKIHTDLNKEDDLQSYPWFNLKGETKKYLKKKAKELTKDKPQYQPYIELLKTD